MAQLVYETTDTEFADRAVEAMRDAGISCYRTGRGYSDRALYPGKGFTEDQVCIYIENDTDYVEANEILIKLGAVTGSDRLPPKWVFVLLALLAVIIGTWVASEWK